MTVMMMIMMIMSMAVMVTITMMIMTMIKMRTRRKKKKRKIKGKSNAELRDMHTEAAPCYPKHRQTLVIPTKTVLLSPVCSRYSKCWYYLRLIGWLSVSCSGLHCIGEKSITSRIIAFRS